MIFFFFNYTVEKLFSIFLNEITYNFLFLYYLSVDMCVLICNEVIQVSKMTWRVLTLFLLSKTFYKTHGLSFSRRLGKTCLQNQLKPMSFGGEEKGERKFLTINSFSLIVTVYFCFPILS